MGEAVEQRRRHLGIAEHGRPLADAQVRRDDDAGSLVELARIPTISRSPPGVLSANEAGMSAESCGACASCCFG
jgi:hypothetical protein